MPNWIEGSLKLRGSYNVYHSEWNDEKKEFESVAQDKSQWMSFEEYAEGTYFSLLNNGWAHVDGTKRAFISTDQHEVFIEKPNKLDPPDPESPVIVACEIHQAWGFRPEDWVAVSQKYHVDIVLYGIESGLGFDQTITILNGALVEDKTNDYGKSYNSFLWHCPFPWMGG